MYYLYYWDAHGVITARRRPRFEQRRERLRKPWRRTSGVHAFSVRTPVAMIVLFVARESP